ncbi:MAG: hypothetical protein NZ839_00525 [Endomicrobia bacterium]|nr:hypothetical protein [Endomicrobiia bacterium]
MSRKDKEFDYDFEYNEDEGEVIKDIAFDIIDKALTVENESIKTNEEYAFERLLEMCSPEVASPLDNCKQILTELRTFGNDPRKLILLLQKFKENLFLIESKSEIRRLISRLLRVFFRTKKLKHKKGSVIKFDEKNN